jgi:hypothetical protein
MFKQISINLLKEALYVIFLVNDAESPWFPLSLNLLRRHMERKGIQWVLQNCAKTAEGRLHGNGE